MAYDVKDLISRIESEGGPDRFFSSDHRIQIADQESIVRRAVSIIRRFRYEPSMTLDEVDKVGESIQLDVIRDPDGAKYFRVNVGAGGNAHMLYFPQGNEDPLRFVVIDTTDLYRLEAKEDGSLNTVPVEMLG